MAKTKTVIKTVGATAALVALLDIYIIHKELRIAFPHLDSRTRRRAWHLMVKELMQNEHPELMRYNPHLSMMVYQDYVTKVTQQ